jgi:hypothetical protein
MTSGASGTKGLMDVITLYPTFILLYLATSLADLLNLSLDTQSCCPCHTFYFILITNYVTWCTYSHQKTTLTRHQYSTLLTF